MMFADTQGVRVGLVQIALGVGGESQERFHFRVERKTSGVFADRLRCDLCPSANRLLWRIAPAPPRRRRRAMAAAVARADQMHRGAAGNRHPPAPCRLALLRPEAKPAQRLGSCIPRSAAARGVPFGATKLLFSSITSTRIPTRRNRHTEPDPKELRSAKASIVPTPLPSPVK